MDNHDAALVVIGLGTLAGFIIGLLSLNLDSSGKGLVVMSFMGFFCGCVVAIRIVNDSLNKK